MKRRDVLLGGGLVALAAGWQVFGVRAPVLDWRDIGGLPGWRRAMAGQISGGVDPLLAGLPSGAATAPMITPVPVEDIADLVFRGSGARIAVFSDHFCPYCRVLFARLAQRGEPIAWHELPLLRPESHIAARAGEAARRQGGYAAFQRVIIARGFRPAPVWLSRLAGQAGLNQARFEADFRSAEVAAGLRASARAAHALGVFATPGLVLERSVVLGAISDAQIDAVLGARG